VINIASGKGTTVKQLAQGVAKAIKKKLEPVYKNPRPGDIRHSVASVLKAKKILGWETKISLTEGLTKTADYFSATVKKSK
jgi:nucleoside-diphosphate-sugar epimerase